LVVDLIMSKLARETVNIEVFLAALRPGKQYRDFPRIARTGNGDVLTPGL
jgi:hypothetical protein